MNREFDRFAAQMAGDIHDRVYAKSMREMEEKMIHGSLSGSLHGSPAQSRQGTIERANAPSKEEIHRYIVGNTMEQMSQSGMKLPEFVRVYKEILTERIERSQKELDDSRSIK